MNHKNLIYLTREIRRIEELAETKFNISSSSMMQRAGRAAFNVLLRNYPKTQCIAVFCGGGNNGGDGFVFGYAAYRRGLNVILYQVGEHSHLSQAANEAYLACQNAAIPVIKLQAQTLIETTDIIVDAVCGTGLTSDLRPEALLAVRKMQEQNTPIISLDVPTGINADTGEVLGMAVKAEMTITFVALKLGLLTGEGLTYTGKLICNDLELPEEIFAEVTPVAEKIKFNNYRHYIKARNRNFHKGEAGHVLIIGGEQGFSGAPRMAGLAALRVGAGLVSIATRHHHAALINIANPELMSHGVEQEAELEALLKKAKVVVVGPGLGLNAWGKKLFNAVCNYNLPLIVDADGLNILADMPPLIRENWILTPHPGEAGRLLQVKTSVIQQDRLQAILQLQKKYNAIIVLKGAGSIIANADQSLAVCTGLVAQDIPLSDATKLAVYLHAKAGDQAAHDGQRGMIASDLMPHLRQLSNV
jgi:ADP-dependent NAD(P)H-hydrate dehydratase / NAD(P)H-hydrate epimerase